ncbi:MAG: FAD-binding protein, partial [Ktedonobacteraceae bacterium]|nr:FAD-binding protein [Ktedonobacteraceae bacterium]
MKALFHLLRARFSDWDERKPLPAGFIDDASRLNQTRIAEIVTPSHSGGSVEDQLRRHVQHARDKKLPLSIAGTRHTMGGQTFTPGGMVLNMLDLRQMHLDEQNNILHVQAGACWSDVLCYL